MAKIVYIATSIDGFIDKDFRNINMDIGQKISSKEIRFDNVETKIYNNGLVKSRCIKM